MRSGFVLGAALGVGLGAVGGAVEGRHVARHADDLAAEVDALRRLLREDPDEFARLFNQLVDGMTDAERAAFSRELAGRRFVDAQDYQPAKAEYDNGASAAPPEHRYGEQAFDDWSVAARLMDEHARSGQPLTVAELQAAHAAAAKNLGEGTPGAIRPPEPNGETLIGAGGLGYRDAWSALTPSQLAALEKNPHIRLVGRNAIDDMLTPTQVAAGMETAVITYPHGGEVPARLDAFFQWYRLNLGLGDPVAFAAEAQRHLVSIHPFADGNGRVTRLVMDHALQSEGLPPALLRDTRVDYLVSSDAWAHEVREGVIETWQTVARHIEGFNVAIRRSDPIDAAVRWAALLSLTSDPDATVEALYAP